MKTTHRLTVVVLPMALIAGGAFILLSRPSVGEAPKPSGKESPEVVGRIGEYAIVRAELEERLVRAIRPREEEYAAPVQPVTAEATLREMLAEKAMSMEGRRLGYLNEEQIHSSIEEIRQGQLVRMVRENCLRDLPVAEATEVDRLTKQNPKFTREQATSLVQRAAASKVLEQVYKGLVEKFQLKRLEENFMQAALIHQRLLTKPVEPRGPGEYWIKNSQVRNELSEKEKGLVLATYQGGQFTLKDWFQVICNMAPPRRPNDLNTPAGVGRLLDWAIQGPILVAEAKARGYDKDPKFLSDIKQVEDQRLFYKAQEEKIKSVPEVTVEQAKTYFEQNAERFARPAQLKINQIWCESQEAAQKVKAALESGADFETAKKAHSLQKEETPHNVSAVGEGLFWAELWKADPNQILGPVKGFYGSGVKWRIVKILERTPPKAQPYSEQVANSVKWALTEERQKQALEEYHKQLLAKYPHEIFQDRIKDMDPVQIALSKKEDK